jgi:acetyl esterase/lipase
VFAGLDDVAKMQPGTYADGDEAPMLLLHGGRDGTVYPVNSHALAERVRAAGGDAEVIELPDLGHIGVLLALARPFRRQGCVADQVAAFIHRH